MESESKLFKRLLKIGITENSNGVRSREKNLTRSVPMSQAKKYRNPKVTPHVCHTEKMETSCLSAT